jgi:hypothetical protein
LGLFVRGFGRELLDLWLLLFLGFGSIILAET